MTEVGVKIRPVIANRTGPADFAAVRSAAA